MGVSLPLMPKGVEHGYTTHLDLLTPVFTTAPSRAQMGSPPWTTTGTMAKILGQRGPGGRQRLLVCTCRCAVFCQRRGRASRSPRPKGPSFRAAGKAPLQKREADHQRQMKARGTRFGTAGVRGHGVVKGLQKVPLGHGVLGQECRRLYSLEGKVTASGVVAPAREAHAHATRSWGDYR